MKLSKFLGLALAKLNSPRAITVQRKVRVYLDRYSPKKSPAGALVRAWTIPPCEL